MRTRARSRQSALLAMVIASAVGFAGGLASTGADTQERQCAALAETMYRSHDYTGTVAEQACFGEEDDVRVALVLNGKWGE